MRGRSKLGLRWFSDCVECTAMDTALDGRISPEEIRKLRRDLGMTQTDLAEKLHVTRDAVAHWELGRCCPGGPAEILLRQLQHLAAKRSAQRP